MNDFEDFKTNLETLFLIFVFIFAAFGFVPVLQFLMA
tara:strand:- start:248 stop:358 length:111 start_codon:yes stop_codon:yes gene_type:complete